MAATGSSTSNSVAGHPIAMKVGGRRLSVSKSPKAQSYLSTSPNATKDVLTTTTTTADTKASEDYPRPEGGHTSTQDGEKDKQQGKKEDREHKNNKEKPTFEQVKEKVQNNNPPQMNLNHSIKQPSGKVM